MEFTIIIALISAYITYKFCIKIDEYSNSKEAFLNYKEEYKAYIKENFTYQDFKK